MCAPPDQEIVTLSIFTFLENLDQFDFPGFSMPSCVTKWYLSKTNKERYQITEKVLDILKNNGILENETQ